ncbi:hypothetical protein BDV93DRAFT_601329 [Ceratobasidium sp. AG-I]|nr:hypothetical protein BDV93DRAFT_601329 [Ceratobasidium sp. AG-I]
MPHKRAKRSVREAERKNRETDLAPTPLANEPIPKGIARVLGAESVRKAYRARRADEEAGKGGKGTTVSRSNKEGAGRPKEEGIRPGETLREYNRRVEEAHRPLVRAAMKQKGKEKLKSGDGAKEKGKDVKGAAKRKREAEDEGEREEERPVKEFAKFSSSAPRQLHEVAMAPPVLTRGPRGSGVGKGTGVGKPVGSAKAPVSMARQLVLEQERERAVGMYRALKAAKQSSE